MINTFVIGPMGDRALLVRLALPEGFLDFNALDEATRYERMLTVRRLGQALTARLPTEPGWPRELVTGYDSLLVPFEPPALPVVVLRDWLYEQIAHWQAQPGATSQEMGQFHRIGVSYGGAHGPDLEAVARQVGLTPDEVIALHTGTIYSVYLVGFAPGFAYLGALPTTLASVPRRAEPRPKVPAGSVAMAAGLTGIYPFNMPGGWHLLGTTAETVFDPRSDPPARLLPGDRVHFYQVTSDR